MTANLQERNRFVTCGFWRGFQPFFGAKHFAPARFAVPGAPSLTALLRHDSHSSLPSCLPSGSRLTHQCIPGELIHVFFDRGHFPNMVFMLFLFNCSDCTLWRSGTASLTTGTRNLQEDSRSLLYQNWQRFRFRNLRSHHGTSRNGVRKYNPLQSRPPISLEYNDH